MNDLPQIVEQAFDRAIQSPCPARGYTQADDTDVAKTWREHTPVHAPHQVGDDCDAMERSAHLDLPGEFK